MKRLKTDLKNMATYVRFLTSGLYLVTNYPFGDYAKYPPPSDTADVENIQVSFNTRRHILNNRLYYKSH